MVGIVPDVTAGDYSMTGMKRLLIAPVLALAAIQGQRACAGIVTIDFDAVPYGADIDSFYAAKGVVFAGFTAVSGYGETSEPNLAFNALEFASVDTSFGFNSLSFTAGFFSVGTINIYSETGGSGILLASLTGALGDANAFVPYTIAFSGAAHSFTLAGEVGSLGIDDLVFAGVPEPASWSLIIAGFAMTGTALRRRSRARA